LAALELKTETGSGGRNLGYLAGKLAKSACNLAKWGSKQATWGCKVANWAGEVAKKVCMEAKLSPLEMMASPQRRSSLEMIDHFRGHDQPETKGENNTVFL